MKKRLTLVPAALGACLAASAQMLPIVDLTMADNGAGQLEVRARPTQAFDGMVDQLIFTLRWREQAGPAVANAKLVPPLADCFELKQYDVVHGGNSYQYLTIRLLGHATLGAVGAGWHEGIEHPICVFDLLPPYAEVIMGNDAFTYANKVDYQITLNGTDRTGRVYGPPVPTVDIAAIGASHDFLEVRMAPKEEYFGWVSSIDLTLRWPDNGASLGPVWQSEAMADAIPMSKVGGEEAVGGFVYQRFHGEGLRSLAAAGAGWRAGEEPVLMRLPFTGELGEPAVADDEWTADSGHPYRIALNGQPAAGSTDDLLMGLAPVFGDIIPQMRVVGDELLVVTSPEGKGTLVLSVLNSAGQPLTQRRAKWGVQERFNMAGWAAGFYTLRVQTDQGFTARRFVK